MNRKNPRSGTVLFDEKGPKNTKKCFEAVAERVQDLGLEHVVVASTTGETGAAAVDFFEDLSVRVIVVSHQYGFREDNEIELEEKHKQKIEKAAHADLVVTPDVLTRVPKITRGKYGGFSHLDLIADTLRMFGEGMKVCIEISVQAADSGKIEAGKETAVIAGTGHGADTGIILEGQHSHKLFDIDVREIVCMPRFG